jgi:hypothetical protein
MKRLIVMFCFWMTWLPLFGQEIIQAEYFIDEDPGYGNATPIAVAVGTDVEMNFTIPPGDIGFGIHTLCVRVKDSNGKWSQTFKRIFIVQQLSSDPDFPVSKMEYFIDEDPGYGNATPIAVAVGTDVEMNFTIPPGDIGFGIRTLYARVKDSNGKWSQTFRRIFIVQQLSSDPDFPVSKMEYFFDEDPGFGQGMPIEIQSGDDITVAVEIPLSSLPEGLHTLYVRARDDNGSWGLVFYRSFLKFFASEDEPLVSRMEYFVNTDPGFGNGVAINMNTPKDIAMKYFLVDPQYLQPGNNTLYVRALDTRGRWGLVYHKTFEALQDESCEPPNYLAAGEVTETTASLGWTEQGQATSWDLLLVPNGMDYSEDSEIAPGIEANPTTFENLFQATLYDFYVRSACTDGQVSPWAGPAQFHTLPLPTYQLILAADPPEGGMVTGEGYYTYGETVNITATPNENYIFLHWSGSTTYVDNNDTASATVTMPGEGVSLTAHFQPVTGSENPDENGFRVFPNPAADKLHLQFYKPDSKSILLIISNLQGQVVEEIALSETGYIQFTMDVSYLETGVYILQIKGEQQFPVTKIFVAR